MTVFTLTDKWAQKECEKLRHNEKKSLPRLVNAVWFAPVKVQPDSCWDTRSLLQLSVSLPSVSWTRNFVKVETEPQTAPLGLLEMHLAHAAAATSPKWHL